MSEKTTICSICEKFKIKQFNNVYKILVEENINPLNISSTELGRILYKENNKPCNLELLEITNANDKDKEINFFGKWIKTINKEKNIQEKIEKNKDILLILEDLNFNRKSFFKTNNKFQLSSTNIELIQKLIKKGYKKEDFFKVHRYVGYVYKNSDFDKTSEGFYFKPTTIYQFDKFSKRLEEANDPDLRKWEKREKEWKEVIIKIIENFNEIIAFDFNKQKEIENNEINQKYILKWLYKGYTLEDFINVNKYIIKIYKENSNPKIAEGFYFKPTTICDDKFSLRVENAIRFLNEENNKGKNEEEELNKILEKLDNK